jgi:hypothetical protein
MFATHHNSAQFQRNSALKMKIRPCYIDVLEKAKAISNTADVKKIPIIIDMLQNVADADIELFCLCGRSGVTADLDPQVDLDPPVQIS